MRIDWPGLKTLAFELGLPNVIETTAWDNPCLKAHGKMWTWWSASADAPVFKVSRDERDVLLDAGGDEFFVTDHYRPHGLVLVRPDRFDPRWARANLMKVWRAQAPNRFLRAWDAARC